MPRTIAIVDDDPAIIETTARYLARHGYAVWDARNPEAFVARAVKAPPDAVILDMQMGDGGGPAAIAAIRARPELSRLKVIICSGMPVEHQKDWAKDLPGARFLAKPFDVRTLKKLLEGWFPPSPQP